MGDPLLARTPLWRVRRLYSRRHRHGFCPQSLDLIFGAASNSVPLRQPMPLSPTLCAVARETLFASSGSAARSARLRSSARSRDALEQVPISWNRASQCERPETLPNQIRSPAPCSPVRDLDFSTHWAPKPVPSSLRSGRPFIRRPPTTIAPFPSPSRGRDAHYCAPPAQIRTSGFPAYGSCLGCLTANLCLAACRTRSRPCGAPSRPCVRSVRSCPAFPLAPPSLHGLRRRFPGLVRRFAATMAGSDFSRPFVMRFGSSPSACGPGRPMACGWV